jgi:hypothetical protein
MERVSWVAKPFAVSWLAMSVGAEIEDCYTPRYESTVTTWPLNPTRAGSKVIQTFHLGSTLLLPQIAGQPDATVQLHGVSALVISRPCGMTVVIDELAESHIASHIDQEVSSREVVAGDFPFQLS